MGASTWPCNETLFSNLYLLQVKSSTCRRWGNVKMTPRVSVICFLHGVTNSLSLVHNMGVTHSGYCADGTINSNQSVSKWGGRRNLAYASSSTIKPNSIFLALLLSELVYLCILFFSRFKFGRCLNFQRHQRRYCFTIDLDPYKNN